jgi:very-short-patch-repair endonuclease
MGAQVLRLNPKKSSRQETTDAAATYKKAIQREKRQKWENMLAVQIDQVRLPSPEREYRFAALAVGWDVSGDPKANKGKGALRSRLNKAKLGDWRFDFCWPKYGLALEIEGAPGRGRHTSAKGFKEDCLKYNEAWMLGWSVLRVTGDMVNNGVAINLLIRAFQRLDREREERCLSDMEAARGAC